MNFSELKDIYPDDDIDIHSDIESFQLVELTEKPKPEDKVVYWESQGKDRICALHAINSLLQGPFFSEEQLAEIGCTLDEKERYLLSNSDNCNTSKADVVALLRGESLNVANDGFFSFPVVEECLKTFNIYCCKWPSKVGCDDEFHIDQEKGFLCIRSEHWFCLRKIGNQWYNLDSLKKCPQLLTLGNLRDFLKNLIQHKSLVFCVRFSSLSSELNKVYKWKEREHIFLNRNQFYLSDSQIEEMSAMVNKSNESYTECQGSDRHGGKNKSTKSCVFTGVGRYSLLVSNTSSFFLLLSQLVEENTISHISQGSRSDSVSDLDEDLQKAIELSLHEYIKNLEAPPNEPDNSVTNEDIIFIQVRFPNQLSKARKFYKTNIIRDIFVWIEYLQIINLSNVNVYFLLTQFPKREFKRFLNGPIYLSQKLIKQSNDTVNIEDESTKEEFSDVTNAPLDSFFKISQQFILRI